MLLLSDLLNGVPVEQQPRVAAEFIKSSWANHFENMKMARQKGNPIADEALREVCEGKWIAKQALESGLLTDPNAQSIALMFSKVSLPKVSALAGWSQRSKRIEP